MHASGRLYAHHQAAANHTRRSSQNPASVHPSPIHLPVGTLGPTRVPWPCRGQRSLPPCSVQRCPTSPASPPAGSSTQHLGSKGRTPGLYGSRRLHLGPPARGRRHGRTPSWLLGWRRWPETEPPLRTHPCRQRRVVAGKSSRAAGGQAGVAGARRLMRPPRQGGECASPKGRQEVGQLCTTPEIRARVAVQANSRQPPCMHAKAPALAAQKRQYVWRVAAAAAAAGLPLTGNRGRSH